MQMNPDKKTAVTQWPVPESSFFGFSNFYKKIWSRLQRGLCLSHQAHVQYDPLQELYQGAGDVPRVENQFHTHPATQWQFIVKVDASESEVGTV